MTTIVVIIIILLVIRWLYNLGQSQAEEQRQKINRLKEQKRRAENKSVKQVTRTNYGAKITIGYSNDDSVIDVTGNSYSLNPKSSRDSIPWFWGHINSLKELEKATTEQKLFFRKFKQAFREDKPIFGDGVDSYIQLLQFDIINDYVNDNVNSGEFDEVISELSKIEETYRKSYVCYSYQELARTLFRANKGFEGFTILQRHRNYRSNEQEYYSEYDERLGTQLKKELNLSNEEVKALNRVYASNQFDRIPYCKREIAKLYLYSLDKLEDKLKEQGTTLNQEMYFLADLITRKQDRYRSGSDNYIWSLESNSDVSELLFKLCSNHLRTHLNYQRKSEANYHYASEQVQLEFNNRIVLYVQQILDGQTEFISSPSNETLVELNSHYSSRWKNELQLLVDSYSGAEDFFSRVLELGEMNKRTSSRATIYFDACKFLYLKDRLHALKLYSYHVFYSLSNESPQRKPLQKKMTKELFNTEEQLLDFESIITDLESSRNVENALDRISHLYEIKRRQITLDADAIERVKEQHSGTVDLLSSYLEDNTVGSEMEFEDSSTEPQLSIEEDSIEAKEGTSNSSFILGFDDQQMKLLEEFESNSLTLSSDQMTQIASKIGAFKNQLIDGINDSCFEILDDVLIEENEDRYTIFDKYYDKIKQP